MSAAQLALKQESNLDLGDPTVQKPIGVHERARQQKNYENMRKMLQKPGAPADGAKNNPFDEDDIGKRFQLLKDQMNVQENESNVNQSALSLATQKVLEDDPAGPVSGGYQRGG